MAQSNESPLVWGGPLIRPLPPSPEIVQLDTSKLQVEGSQKISIGIGPVKLFDPLVESDAQILEQIYTTHVHSDTKFDVASLFTIVDNTLKRATHIVDQVVQGSKPSVEHIDIDKLPQTNFNSPLCTLRQISSEMTCNAPGSFIAHITTKEILNKLSNYEWDAKAVLTLAAFSLEYGDFWLLAQHQTTDYLAKSVGVLKRVPLLTKPQAVAKHREAIIEINTLVKTTLQVIELIFELEQLTTYDTKDVPALLPAMEQIPIDVYWAIITIAAIETQIDCLTTDSEQKQDLSPFGQKINIILSKLRNQIKQCRLQIEEAEYIRKLRKFLQCPTEIMEVFKYLIFTKDAPQKLYDGATKTTVDISVIKKKNVYLFFSTLDITEEEIAVLRPVYDHIRVKDQYKIVWIPVVEEWTEQLRKKFESLKSKMPWYVVHHYGSLAGYKYIKEEWHFTKKPMVVVLNTQGKVLHTNAFHLIHAYGIKAFPFTFEDQERIDSEVHWIGSIVSGIYPSITTAIKEEKYIFFYGGKDKEWIQQFNKYATALTNDAALKEAKIYIELFCVEKEDKSLVNRFWSGIESLFVTKVNNTTDAVTQEVQKMLSYKNETGWALICKGSTVVTSGHGSTILKVVAEFDKWKEVVIKSGFEVSFKGYHEKIVKTTHRCSHLEIPNVAGKLPQTIKCPDCPKSMEIYISYKCCHTETTTSIAKH